MLISKVQLQTNYLTETKLFYTEILGFQLIEEKEDSFIIKVGESELEFKSSSTGQNPFYHFAFNIPRNKFQEAKEWTRSRVLLDKEEGEDEVYFQFINAYSFYFTDSSGNIVEFIARHDESSDSFAPFSVESILHISEINLTTNDVFQVGEKLKECGIPVRNNNPVHDGLNFMGEKGSFILLGPPKRRWFFSEKDAESFPLTIEIDGNKIIRMNDLREVILYK